MPEPIKLRSTDAAETAKLSDFQAELVQLGAALNGDHAKAGLYPHRLVENMTVAEGAQYVRDAFKRFLEECENCRMNGADGSHVVAVVEPAVSGSDAASAMAKKKKSFFGSVFSCLVCNRSS